MQWARRKEKLPAPKRRKDPNADRRGKAKKRKDIGDTHARL